MNRLREKYQQQILPALQKELKLDNPMAVPKLQKIILNVGVTDAQHRKQAIESVTEQVKVMTGQKPAIRVARKSIAGFKLRQGDPVGVAVTLRGERMYEFLDKVISVVLPRVKDFQGLPTKLDGGGNYNFGLKEQIIFPEIDYDKIDYVRGMQITIVTSTADDNQARLLLDQLGIPFVKEEAEQN